MQPPASSVLAPHTIVWADDTVTQRLGDVVIPGEGAGSAETILCGS